MLHDHSLLLLRRISVCIRSSSLVFTVFSNINAISEHDITKRNSSRVVIKGSQGFNFVI
jgi:hypothetical protein